MRFILVILFSFSLIFGQVDSVQFEMRTENVVRVWGTAKDIGDYEKYKIGFTLNTGDNSHFIPSAGAFTLENHRTIFYADITNLDQTTHTIAPYIAVPESERPYAIVVDTHGDTDLDSLLLLINNDIINNIDSIYSRIKRIQ